MEIILVRHGKPICSSASCWLNTKDFGQWLKAYQASKIDPSSAHCVELLGVMENAHIISSELFRAYHSAEIVIQKFILHKVQFIQGFSLLNERVNGNNFWSFTTLSK